MGLLQYSREQMLEATKEKKKKSLLNYKKLFITVGNKVDANSNKKKRSHQAASIQASNNTGQYEAPFIRNNILKLQQNWN